MSGVRLYESFCYSCTWSYIVSDHSNLTLRYFHCIISSNRYGNVYTATGNDFEMSDAGHCSGVIFLCTLESFLGLIYAGMCAAILFGKVNRVQSHAHLTFANAVCFQYEELDLDQFVDDDSSDSDLDDCLTEEDEEDKKEDNDDRRVSFEVRPSKVNDAGL